MILGRDLLTSLGLDIIFSDDVIIGSKVPYERFSAPMVDVSNHESVYITYKTVKPEESFINSYVGKCFESDSAISSTRIMIRILGAKYKKANLNNVMAEKYQHLNAAERYRLINILKRFEDLFDGTSGMLNTTSVDF